MSAPATPTTVTAQSFPSDAPTGTWRHPRLDEITKRVQASTFDERNVRLILLRLALFPIAFVLYHFNGLLRWLFRLDLINLFYASLPPSIRFVFYPVAPILMLVWTLLPLRPLFMQTDDISDIALTPKQRALLGLKPTSQPATPGSQYITPPRYSRSVTPRSGTSSASGSPFSGKGSPLGSGLGQSSFSPTASPLFQKAMGRDGNRRLSYGSQLGAGRPNDSSSSLASQISNSPSAGKGSSVPINSRWLYERGRRSSSGLKGLYS